MSSSTTAAASASCVLVGVQGISEGGVCQPHVKGVELHTVVGSVFAGHYSPAHKEPEVLPLLTDVFRKYDIVAGDFNAAPYHLENHGMMGPPGSLSHTCSQRNGTYLPNVPRAGHSNPIRLPQFDAIFVRRSKLTAAPCPLLRCPTLPASVPHYQNPRTLLRSQPGLDSDHIPVVATISALDTTTTLTLMTYNVADPLFWAKYHPGMDEGFAPADEHARQQRVLRFIEGACEALDVVCLQEVPIAMVPALEQLVASSSRGLRMRTSRAFCKKNPQDPDKSYLVVIARSSCML